MIEAVFADLCRACNRCVEIWPTNVFDPGENGIPAIARQADCQTCFMCELYCPADALYVAPDCERPVEVDLPTLRASGLLGQFRRDSGWDEWGTLVENEHWRMDEIFRRARNLPENDMSVVPLVPGPKA